MQWETRLRKLERSLEATNTVSQNTGFRVAGKSRSEVFAEMLVYLFRRLEAASPGTAAAIVDAAQSKAALPPDTPEEIERLIAAIRNGDRINPGLPGRVLEAVLCNVDAITEETLFPAGRPAEEETFYSRQGGRFSCRLDNNGCTGCDSIPG